MRLRHPLAWGLVCGVLGAGLSARAQPQPIVEGDVPGYRPCSGQVTRAEQDAAKGLFAAGRQAYEEGEYARAIRYWRDAFDLDCNAVVMLRNLANAYERARNLRGAVVSLEAYLQRKPDADDAPTVRRRIENLRRELESSPPPPPASSPPASASAAPAASSAPAPWPSASSAIGSTVVVDRRGPGPWPWVVTGVGGAALAAGVYFYVDGSARVSDARDKCGGDALCDPDVAAERKARDDGNRGRTFQGVGLGLMGVGGAAVAGGLTWYFLSAPKRSSAPSGAGLWVVPALGPGYGGLGAGGRF
ncbi:MAG TPA: tetratricopeptide repeat protein [Polyangiaceae bacterium]|nr:tetratricopeptide repeat protein [Polyangiaceae bacterium]